MAPFVRYRAGLAFNSNAFIPATSIYMPKQRATALDLDQEPMGIVISRGSREEEAPRFSAYVWGPVPDAEVSADTKMVAA